ncbi:MAG TPA: methyltransferase domain-containing protein [Stellaceae bacterium]|nr:methyltransferase domain-containing protein [Stellaceae bacterium]
MTEPQPYPAMQWTDALAARYWRWQAQFPDQYFTHRFGALIARQLRPWLKGRRSVLDYGCGLGFLEPHLAALGMEVSATDISPEAVAAANARNHGIAGFRGAVLLDELLAAERRYDAVISIEVIEHLADEHLDGFLDALRRLLAPGGVAIITTPHEEDLRAAEIYCPACNHVFHRWQHLRSWSGPSLTAALAARGLAVERVFATDFARAPWRQPGGAVKRMAKRLLGRAPAAPHLVCIARGVL